MKLYFKRQTCLIIYILRLTKKGMTDNYDIQEVFFNKIHKNSTKNNCLLNCVDILNDDHYRCIHSEVKSYITTSMHI